MNDHNIILMTDSYKVSHWLQYPPKTSKIYSYFESRGGRWPETTFFGLQYFLMRYLEGVQVTREKIAEAKDYFSSHFPGGSFFNEEGWEHILNEHGGRLPVEIKAVPEGTTVPIWNVLMTIENTDPACYWLTNYLETLLVQVWYPTTVCTNSRMSRRVISRYLEDTGTPEDVDFKLHDFGYRGSTSVESAGIGGLAHLVSFKGTDTLAAIQAAKKYYGAEMPGFSVPAAEHSTITSWGRENEVYAYKNMLDQYPTGLVAVVSDSYDIFQACEDIWGEQLRKKVLSRDGVLVIRPDSGNPPDIVVRVLEILGRKFGYSTVKGYKVLDPHVRVIQGDGIDHNMIISVLDAMKESDWSADNIAFGSGGGLLQKVNRDSQRFAFKCSAATIAGKDIDVSKNPITDQGKVSKPGRLALIKDFNNEYKTVRENTMVPKDNLRAVFLEGSLFKKQTFDEVRERALEGIKGVEHV